MRREAVTLDCSGDGNAAGGLCVDGERATVTGFFQRTRPAAGAAAGDGVDLMLCVAAGDR
jgi:hypothetical protein